MVDSGFPGLEPSARWCDVSAQHAGLSGVRKSAAQVDTAVSGVTADGQLDTYVCRGFDKIVPSSVTIPTDTLLAEPSIPIATKRPPRIVSYICSDRSQSAPALEASGGHR
jgi:hypothetical protein